MLCVTDALLGMVCHYPCVQLDDCPNLATICDGTSCQLNSCGGSTGNGSFNGVCDVAGVGDGTCSPQLAASGKTFGLCSEGGSTDGGCNPSASRSDLAAVCPAGQVCIGGSIGSGGICGNACDPSAVNSCPSGQVCAITIDDPLAGACVN